MQVDHRWFTADEAWPDHAKPWWAEALREARGAGWQLRTFSGHTWGKVVCDREVPDAHEMLIFSTGRGGENAAKQLEKLIRRCHHKQSSPPNDDIERASRVLDGASTLLDAAELLLSAADKLLQAEELLSLAEDAIASAEDSDAFLDAATDDDLQRIASQVDAGDTRWPDDVLFLFSHTPGVETAANALARWESLFRDELALIHAGRNRLAHGGHVSDDELNQKRPARREAHPYQLRRVQPTGLTQLPRRHDLSP